MSYMYDSRKRTNDTGIKPGLSPNGPSLDALRTGSAVPSPEQMGHRVDLPDAMREKMENAFGADLSAVKLYESQSVEDAGANAVTQGSNIAFAPGMLDFTSYGGQALLGHEISHVVSQARGEVSGSGFLNDHALEARADREGAMAASGQQISAPSTAMSGVTAAPASSPMQASKATRRKLNNNMNSQADLLVKMAQMQRTNPQGYSRDQDYMTAQSQLSSARTDEYLIRQALTNEDTTKLQGTSSIGDRVLDRLWKKNNKRYTQSYLKDAVAAANLSHERVIGANADEDIDTRLNSEILDQVLADPNADSAAKAQAQNYRNGRYRPGSRLGSLF
jgi:hypothetical protein